MQTIHHSLARRFLRGLYRALPCKRALLHFLRGTGAANLLSMRIKRFLVFAGPFDVQTENGHSFTMLGGYGRDIEATVFWEGVQAFERTTMLWWGKLAKRSKYVVDIGANTGIYSLVAKTLSPGAEVHAFEPLDRIYAILSRNFDINNAKAPAPPLRAHQFALSDYSGSGEMFDLPVEHMYTASLNRDVHAERGQAMQSIQEAVPVMRLDDFLQQRDIQGLDLIKIDVESHEPAVIRGMGMSLRRFHPSMIVEIWSNEIGEAVEETLQGCDYLYFSLTKELPLQTEHIRNESPDKGYINYLVCTKAVAIGLGLING